MRERHSVRLLVVDERDRVLLFKIEVDGVHEPDVAPGEAARVFWITPGGGIEAGEDDRAAGLRELWEETGILLADLGPCVWEQDHPLIVDGELLRMRERYYLIRVPTRDIALDHQTDLERAAYRAHHWWSADELADATAVIFPAALRTGLAALLAGDIPDRPIRIE